MIQNNIVNIAAAATVPVSVTSNRVNCSISEMWAGISVIREKSAQFSLKHHGCPFFVEEMMSDL